MDRICFKVNGVDYSVGCEEFSSTTLVDYLRNSLALTGVKYMCREGGCGACIVAVSKKPGEPQLAVNSCLVPITLCKDWDIKTIEELGNRKDGYHVIQKTLAEHNGSQCGHCSTGFVMSMYSLLVNNPKPTMLEVENYFSSNVCRCTGYRSILEAFKTFATDSPKPTLLDIEDLNICRKNDKTCAKTDCTYDQWCFVDKDEIKVDDIIKINLMDNKVWYKVYTVSDIFKILKNVLTDYILIAGNTGKGTITDLSNATIIKAVMCFEITESSFYPDILTSSRFGGLKPRERTSNCIKGKSFEAGVYPIDEYPPTIIDISSIQELKGYLLDQNLIIKSGTTLTELMKILNDVGSTEAGFVYLNELYNHLKKVAHTAVRNVGTIGGNLMLKHKHNEFASDIFMMLSTVGAMVTIQRRYNIKETISMEEFLNINMKDCVIINVILPPLGKDSMLYLIKVSPRYQNSHCVSAGFHYTVNNNIVTSSRIFYAGLSAGFQRAKLTEAYLNNRNLFTNATVQGAVKMLDMEVDAENIPGELSAKYREKLAVALFYKGILNLCPKDLIGTRYRSGALTIHDTRPVSTATQVYNTNPALYPINEPWPKVDGLIQCAGEAHYTEDLPQLHREVFGAFLLTTVGLGTIVSIDATEAMKYPGVLAVYTAQDIPGSNNFLPPEDPFSNGIEEVFCSGEIKYFNEPYGVIVAETRHIADVAAKMVRVIYTNVRTPVTDVKEASKDPSRIKLFFKADAQSKGNKIAKVIKGSNTTPGQYHFTMETVACVSVPTEEGLRVYCTSQWLDGVQISVASALNIEENRVDVQVRRLGGAYGAKVTRTNRAAVGCSLIAYKLNRPCRLIQSLPTNTRSFGKRTTVASDYEVAVSSTGAIQYMNYNLFFNDGYIDSELIISVGETVYFNCYDKTRWNFKSYNCFTDTAKNTWCRSPGTFEHITSTELIMEQISYEMSLDPMDVRLANIDNEKYGDIVSMVNDAKQKGEYESRKSATIKFNKENRWIKRGLRVAFLRWSTHPLAGLEVNMSVFHADGSVIITHGGIEMGQGIDTKAIQICASLLNIDKSQIIIKGNNTIIAPNCIYTAGSVTSQNSAIGIRKCCEELLRRLEPIKQTMNNPTWPDLITKAFDNGVDLQVHYHVTLDDYIETTLYGVAIAEVEVDILTGQTEIKRVDLLQDVGQSVNPEVDLGQIEGAFIMGQGAWTSEHLIYHPSGELLTDRTWNYFVPQARDIPQDFRVWFRNNSYSKPIIFGAKCVQEAPICLSVVISLAIREAITSARSDAQISSRKWFPTDGAFTIERIFLKSKTPIEHYKLY